MAACEGRQAKMGRASRGLLPPGAEHSGGYCGRTSYLARQRCAYTCIKNPKGRPSLHVSGLASSGVAAHLSPSQSKAEATQFNPILFKRT